MKKKCNRCLRIVDLSLFYKDRTTNDGHYHFCKKCVRRKHSLLNEVTKRSSRWLYTKDDVMKDKKYLKDRRELFKNNGNGWWILVGINRMNRRNQYKKFNEMTLW